MAFRSTKNATHYSSDNFSLMLDHKEFDPARSTVFYIHGKTKFMYEDIKINNIEKLSNTRMDWWFQQWRAAAYSRSLYPAEWSQPNFYWLGTILVFPFKTCSFSSLNYFQKIWNFITEIACKWIKCHKSSLCGPFNRWWEKKLLSHWVNGKSVQICVRPVYGRLLELHLTNYLNFFFNFSFFCFETVVSKGFSRFNFCSSFFSSHVWNYWKRSYEIIQKSFKTQTVNLALSAIHYT